MDSRFDDLFLHARELIAAEERSAFLDEVCAGDPNLRVRLEAKLATDEVAAEFFGDVVTRADPARSPGMPGEQPGDIIGAYKLLEQIGEGGFGAVWMADQSAPVRRRVALKIIKPGLDTKEVIARFEQERQALAMMDHANIARVFDAGATRSGRPFFVMELVRGTRITDYCDENGLVIPDRIRLFVQVCHAVHHAHQKGIIHRDLKPSNVLVTVNDGEAAVKVIDFGVAKATLGSLTEATLLTQFHQMIGTPAYMSPEQAEMTSLDIDTRSDIYSLGVLLYELITGRTPIDTTTLARAGLDEIRRVIREVTPLRPSAKVKSLSPEELTTTAKRRRTESTKLTTTMRGDLDWIAMMCLEKDRKRRYDSAHALALDLERYLDHGIVTARPPTASYLLGRLVRRHRSIFAAVAVAFAALVTGLGIALWQYRRAAAAEREQTHLKENALTEAIRSRQVADLLQNMLSGVNPAQARGRDTTVLRGILDRADLAIEKDLKDQPEVAADLRLTLGQVYHAVGEFPKAIAMDRSALKLYRRVFGAQHAKIGTVLNHLGFVLAESNQLNEAEAILHEALAMSEALGGYEDTGRAGVLSGLGYCLVRQGKYTEAEAASREAVTMLDRLRGPGSTDAAAAMVSLGESLGRQHKFPEAETVLRDALKVLEPADGDDHPHVADALASLGYTLSRAGKPAEALPVLQRCLGIERKLYGLQHAKTAGSLAYVAQTLTDLGRFPEAESNLLQVLEMQQKMHGAEHSSVANTLHDLGLTLARQGKFVEAEGRLQQALEMKKKLLGDGHADVAQVLDTLAQILSGQGKHDEAEKNFRDALDMRIRLFGPDHRDVADSWQNLGEELVSQGKPADAVDPYQKSLDIRRKLPGFQHPATAQFLQQVAINLSNLERNSEAEPLARECLELREKLMPDKWQTFYARTLLGQCLLNQKKSVEAEPLLESGCEGMLQRKDSISKREQIRIGEAIEAIVDLHTESGHVEKAAAWQRKLDAFKDGRKF